MTQPQTAQKIDIVKSFDAAAGMSSRVVKDLRDVSASTTDSMISAALDIAVRDIKALAKKSARRSRYFHLIDVHDQERQAAWRFADVQARAETARKKIYDIRCSTIDANIVAALNIACKNLDNVAGLGGECVVYFRKLAA